MNGQCSTCVHWVRTGGGNADYDPFGDCTRYPPSRIPECAGWHFPEVYAHQRCGEHRTADQLAEGSG